MGGQSCAGDEFALINWTDDTAHDSAQLAERLLEAFRAPRNIDGIELAVGCSIGIALAPMDGADPRMYRVSCTRNRCLPPKSWCFSTAPDVTRLRRDVPGRGLSWHDATCKRAAALSSRCGLIRRSVRDVGSVRSPHAAGNGPPETNTAYGAADRRPCTSSCSPEGRSTSTSPADTELSVRSEMTSFPVTMTRLASAGVRLVRA